MEMRKINKIFQWNQTQKDRIFTLSLAVLSLIAFLFVGDTGYVLFTDSHTYMTRLRHEGVMPFYPLFLLVNRAVFGEAAYLSAVVAEQAVVATVCVIFFTRMIKKRFQLHYAEAYIVYFLTLMPYTIEMPSLMITHAILTEGITYSLFYLFTALLLKAVWEKSKAGLAGVWIAALLLSLIRSQLQILFGVCGIAVVYVLVTECKKKNAVSVILRLFAGIVLCGILGIAGILANVTINSAYAGVTGSKNAFTDFAKKIYAGESQQSPSVENDSGQKDTAKTDSDGSAHASRQYTTLLFTRGMYEADYEDYMLFEDERVQELYLYLYDVADATGCRYEYATKGLWMWKDIVGGIGLMPIECYQAEKVFFEELHPEMTDYANIRNEMLTEIGVTLLKAHFGRFLYHTLMLLPQAFICTVFFQIAPLYLLCHLVTLFLYLSAIALTIWAYADKKVNREYAETMAVTLGINIVLVMVISLVFFGQQRYLMYTFGMFYIAYFLLLLQLWKLYGRMVWEKIRAWKKKRKS